MEQLDLLSSKPSRTGFSLSEIDHALTAQLAVAWAGEGGEEKRLGWWRTDLASEFGGEDLFRRLLPNTWPWAVLQGAREAARRKDAELRRQEHDPDRILSLFHLGFNRDERIEERFQDLKRSGRKPFDALPSLREILVSPWELDHFLGWVQKMGSSEWTITPAGRFLKGPLPSSLNVLIQRLVGALSTLADSYPLPHFRRSR